MPPRLHLANDWSPPGEPLPPLPVGVVLPPRERTPQFPLKDRRTLFSDAEIARARANVAQYASARKLAGEIISAAAYWLEWTDADLHALVTSAEVPRAFDCSPAGCPKCGKKIFEAAKSTYPWRIDPRRPFKVECPLCATVFPSNDYGRFYRSGFKDRSDFDGPYVDDGRGWVAPDGERYWFVAHANHWLWYWHPQADNPTLMRGCEALGRAYLLTGDRRYAHKAAVILHRIAWVYPNMDHATQSRFGEILARTAGERYSGKVVNAIWESYLSAQLAETYDAIWETIDGDRELHAFTGRTGPEIRAHIEANLLEEILDGYYEWNTRGNYGMHQRSLLQTALVRQHGDNARYIADVVDKPDGAIFLGMRYALQSLVWRDGHPYEVGDYNFAWASNLTLIAGLLAKLGVDVTGLPRLRRLLDAPITSLCIGRLTPAIGDSQTVYANPVGTDAGLYQQALRTYGDARYAQWLAGLGATGENSFAGFASLFHPPVAAPAEPPAPGRLFPPQPSRLLSGFGLSLLNNPADTVGLSLYHGLHLNHRHFDRLHFDLFAHGQAMMPDLGYPDAMNAMVPGIYTWSLATISHNTVTVDAAMQPGNEAGVVELQAEGGWVRAVAVSAPGTYPQCPVYRRTLIMVDAGNDRSYVVDFFDVAGGRQHDYSLHGPPGEFAVSGDWTAPAPGTLAGPAVPVGALYDDPVLASPDNKEGYAGYRGSGFQHLEKVRRHRGGEWAADYTHERDPAAQLRLRVLPQPDQELILAEARVSPVKWPQILRYVIARRQGADGLASRFVGVIEPHAGVPFLRAAERHEAPGGTAVVVAHASGGTDLILHGAPGVEHRFTLAGHAVATDARVTVVTLAAGGAVERLWLADGTHVTVDGVTHRAAPLTGRVTAVDPANATVRVAPDAAVEADAVAALPGRIVHFGPGRAAANSVASARWEGGELVLQLRDDVITGCVRLRSVAPDRLETASRLMLAATYAGHGLRNAAGRYVGRVRAAGDDWIEPAVPLAAGDLAAGEDVCVTLTSPGDRCEFPAVAAWRR
jgi:hypothetical protein